MTVSGSSSLLNLFQTKIEDAVELVSVMGAEEKLKSVQYWNLISGKLQEIVNNSTVDINALAMKLDESNKKSPYIEETEPNNIQTSIYPSDYINVPSNFPETSSQSSANLTNIPNGFFSQSNTSSSFTSLGFSDSCSSINSTTCAQSSPGSDPALNNCLDVIDNVLTETDITNASHQKKKVKKMNSEPNVLHSDSSYLLELLTNAPTDNSGQQNNKMEDNATSDLNPVPFDMNDSSNNMKTEKSSNNEDKASNQLLMCNWCDSEFQDHVSLETHQQLHTRPFFCTECNAQFASKGNLSVHFRKHTGERPYMCSTCNARFSTRGNLKRHVKSHSGAKPHTCTHCGSCFTEKKSLIVHMRRHTGERPFECKLCGQKFSQSGILQSHMAVHMNEKAHLCEHCGKAFRQKSQLRVHMMRHNGVRKYSCKQCSSSFLIKGDLERHERTHTGVRPFNCNICMKSFTRQQSLKEHMNRHLGLKPFKCKHCTKTFAEMSACYKHTKQHEKLPERSTTTEKNALDTPSTKETLDCEEVQLATEILENSKINLSEGENFTVIFQGSSQEQVFNEYSVQIRDDPMFSNLLHVSTDKEKLAA